MVRTALTALLLLIFAASLAFAGGRAEEGGQETGALETTGETLVPEPYPIAFDGTLTWWGRYGEWTPTGYADINDVPFVEALRERTGVNVVFQAPVGNRNEAFNLMMAARDYPDIIEYGMSGYPGGYDRAISDGVIVPLDELEPHIPAVMRYIEGDPNIARAIRTPGGHLGSFPLLKLDERLFYVGGPAMRGDWLEELGLDVPTTIDEWEEVLTAFQEIEGVTAPISGRPGDVFGTNAQFAGAFGEKRWFYVEDDQIVFGGIRPGYRDFLAKFRDWYAKGLIDPNFASIDRNTENANILTGRSGAVFSTGMSGGLASWNSEENRIDDPDFSIIPVPYPSLEEGGRPKFGSYGDIAAHRVQITTDAADTIAAARLLDYGYTDEGNLLYTFGIEGKSFENVDGMPRFIDESNWLGEVIAMYTRFTNAPTIASADAYIQSVAVPQASNAMEVWSLTEAADHYIPRGVAPLPEEAREWSSLAGDISTYTMEMSYKFIMGVEDLSGWDAYVEQVEALGVERATEILQNGYDAYMGF